MKVAVPATLPEPQSALVDERFGRAPYFLIHDSESKTWEVLENDVVHQPAQGAGVHSAELLSRRGVQAVVAPHCGPKAFNVLQGANIKVYLATSGTVMNAVEQCLSGGLQLAATHDVHGHW